MTLPHCTRCGQPRTVVNTDGLCDPCARKLAGLCAYTGCPQPHIKKGRYCHGHYHQMRRGEPLAPLRGRGGGLPRTEVVAEVAALIGTDTAQGIATRLGYHNGRYGPQENLYRVLHRAGRLDLWQRLKEAA